MSLILLSEARQSGAAKYRVPLYKSAASVLREQASAAPHDATFDVFLCHSYTDAQVDDTAILGVKAILEEFGLRVYVDRLVDSQMTRETVTPGTAATLRHRMRNSSCLFFATSRTSSESIWMPWELGFFDGHNGRVGILPLVATTTTDFRGQE
jgi:hypothetical protein